MEPDKIDHTAAAARAFRSLLAAYGFDVEDLNRRAGTDWNAVAHQLAESLSSGNACRDWEKPSLKDLAAAVLEKDTVTGLSDYEIQMEQTRRANRRVAEMMRPRGPVPLPGIGPITTEEAARHQWDAKLRDDLASALKRVAELERQARDAERRLTLLETWAAAQTALASWPGTKR